MSQYQKKRYFYCQLNEGFFKKHPHDILVEMPNGREAMLLYIELLLESAGHNGRLMFSDTKPFTPELIAAKFHTPLEIVNSSLSLLEQLELLEWTAEKEIILPDFAKYVGSKTHGADQKDEQRMTKGRQMDDKETKMSSAGKTNSSRVHSTEYRVQSTEYKEENIESVHLPRAHKDPTLDEVLKISRNAPTGDRIPDEFVKEWYDLMVISDWRDSHNIDLRGSWRQKLGFAWRDEKKKVREVKRKEQEAEKRKQDEIEAKRKADAAEQRRIDLANSIDAQIADACEVVEWAERQKKEGRRV